MNDRYTEGLFFLARALAGRKNLAEAIDTMKKAVEIDPDNAEYLFHLGLIYEQGQQVQDAVEAFSRSIDKNPKNADAFEHLGLNLMVENRFPEAVTAFKKAADLDSRRARLWAEVGDAEQQVGDVDGAIRDFQRALAQDASLVGVWTKLGIAYKDKDCKGCRTKALDALKRATQVDPADSTAHHELGYMYKDDGRRKEAIAEFRRYLELKPDAGDLSTVQDDIYYLQEESRRAP
jgi:tetratricopeptide (TPR) repeat protein